MRKRNNLLASYRTLLNLKYKQLAEILNITPQAYGLKENGKTPFKDNEKTALVKYFKDNGIDTNIEALFF